MSAVLSENKHSRRTQQERRDATTAALLAATVDAVLDTGPTTGVAEIAQRAGVTKGALQHHFPTKNDLLVAVVADGWNELVARSQHHPDLTCAPAARVRSLIDEMWASYQAPRCRAAFMISSDPNLGDELAARLAPPFESAREHLDAVWNESFADLGLPPDRVEFARRFARPHLLGMLVQRQLPSPEPDPSDELSALAAATLQLMTSAAAP